MKEEETSTGEVFLPTYGHFTPQAGAPILDPAQGMAVPLAAYLRNMDFCRWGAEAPNTPFRLNEVFHEWPEPDADLPYPCACITDITPTEFKGHNFVPTILEDTYEKYGKNTVLWKLASVQMDFQVDFWATDNPTRDAIAARLPSAFSPGENASCIVLCGDCRYWGQKPRCTLMGYQRMDEPMTVFTRVRRIVATIRCEIDVVDLRCANLLQASECYEIGEDVVPGTPPRPPGPPPCKE